MTTLQCPICGTGNRPGRRFCAQCGAGLAVPCPACGFSNEAAEKFCGGCGTPLSGVAATTGAGTAERTAAAAATANAPTASAAVSVATAFPTATSGGERRPVTVLFADLVDYTRMSRTLDPEDVHAMLERFYAAADAIVERYGGSIDKHIGDSVMAVFGAPVAHDDDAIRAIRAAAEIHRAMPSVGSGSGEPLAVHIGIATGEVVASGLGAARNRAYTVIGNSVNLAARLLKLAAAGETVLDDALHAGVQRIARCAPIEGVEVKGIDAPLTAWRFIGFVDLPDRDGGHPFVGRLAELAQLGASLQSCAAGGTGCTVLVRGDAGIGKSRLVGELRRQAIAAGFACHTGLVLDFGMAKGRDAIREIVAGLIRLAPGSDAALRADALRHLLLRHPSLAGDEAFLRDLVDLPQPEGAGALHEAMDNAARQRGRASAVVRLLEAACAQSPVLVIVEDVHWADRVTLDYLAALTRGAGTMSAVLALTSRVAGDPLDAAWRGSVQGSPLVTIDLGPLGTKDALALAGGFLSTPQGFARKCVERSGGNPLFLEQLMHAADEREDHLPASLHSLVLARMDRLPELDRAALRAAAVVGQRFPLALVRHLAQLPDFACDMLVAHFLVRPEGDEFLFSHALIRDGVYASLTRARRAELHRAAADWYGERDPALAAEHLDRADAPEAPRAYLAAARAQSAALQPERALALAERGAALAKEADDVVALNLLRGRLCFESGEGRPAVDAYTVAEAAAQNPEDRCRALIGIAAGQRLLAGMEEALAALAVAEPIAREHGLTRELAEIHYTRGNLCFARGEIAACGTEHGHALACAHALGDPSWEARALSGLADAAYAEGRMRTALARFLHCIELCDAHGLTRIAIPNRVMVGHCRIYTMEFDAGLADMQAALALALEVGDRHGQMFAVQSQGLLLAYCDRHASAGPLFERGLALAEAIGARRYQPLLLMAMAGTALGLGRRDEALEQVDRALTLARESGMRFCGPLLLGIKARLQDDADAREQCRAEAEALLAQGCAGHNAIGYYRNGIEDALTRGEWARALAHAAALEAYTQAEPLPYSDLLIGRARVLVGLASHPDDGALQEELARLRAEAERVRWPVGWTAAGSR